MFSPITPNSQYNLAKPNSAATKVATSARRRMFRHFLDSVNPQPHETLLDVGATSDRSYEASNYLEAWYPHKDHLVAVGIDDASFLESLHPGVRFVRADALKLPFPDASFDIVHSSAVIEHVGGTMNQRRFVLELARVARRAVHFTTPNRWFPIEFHTILPLVHWLPIPLYRRLLASSRYRYFADEDHLNLLTRSDLSALCSEVPGWRYRIDHLRLLGWPSNLLTTLTRA